MITQSRSKQARKTINTIARKRADQAPLMRKLRCAVYTRKSSEEGLDMDFNSLDAQKESCEAYISSQKAEGWVPVADHYDDGGFSGGTLERPALKRLLADVTTGKIDVIVVYKIDRLSRSMLDFLNLVELFERHGATFVSVTQSFNTKDAMGRMALNILVTFAQFERELIGERIRDKVAASRKRGKWMGGWTPLGYEVRDRKLLIHEPDAERVRAIFRRFVQLKSATLLARELIAANERNRYGHLLDKGVLYKLLNNRVYVGEAVHKGTSYPGEHQPIIDKKLWDEVHTILKVSPRKRAGYARAQTPALLRGRLFGPDGAAMSPTHTRKAGRLYRYYVSQTAMKRGGSDCSVRQAPAAELGKIVIDQIRTLLQSPEIIVQTWRAAHKQGRQISESDVRRALLGFDDVWSELFPAEQARIVELLVERIDLHPDRLEVTLTIDGLTSLCIELGATDVVQQAAE
ncbi:DNA invertase Pin-like site-specific DNA recombinase [Tardiphaga robiniae]|uniref:recombinase family protein n=1 Tax=Tardiphaga robiniae TaxID=943830 RepID=UPI00286633A5|nr:recombinase family protein [Tardiphaga robiniae]MDR6657591.1 DNA invertase Pin-like site-specific DNA recombinase [Tardiphaga robiniae]